MTAPRRSDPRPTAELERAVSALGEGARPAGPPRDGAQARRRPGWLLPAGLFLLTAVTTTWAQGPAYSVTLLAILLAHEMGHYLTAKRERVPASLPHFIPLPPILGFGLGTLGAVIRMDGSRADRRQLLEIGAAGPIAGFLVAVPAMILGLRWSQPTVVGPDEPLLYFGGSILSTALEAWFGPPLAPDQELLAHPVYIAAWAGFLVTALNLLPMGQLDGGHVLHAAFPRSSHRIARRLHRALVVLGLLGLAVVLSPELDPELGAALAPLRPWVSPGLLVWALLAGWLGIEHPPAPEPRRPIRWPQWVLMVLSAVILVLCFMPSPVYTPL